MCLYLRRVAPGRVTWSARRLARRPGARDGLLIHKVRHPSMVITSEPDPAFCTAKAQVPNVLHKVWIGRPCPHVYDLVATLTAALLLRPQEIRYHRTFVWSPCYAGGRHKAEMPLESCYRALGVRYTELNLTGGTPLVPDSSSFEQATRDFVTRKSFMDWSHINRLSIAGPPHLSDLVRLHYLHTEGGYYFDADSFILSPNVSRFRSCPFVMSTDQFDRPSGKPIENTTTAEVLAGMYTPGVGVFNNGAMMAVPHSEFGEAWWKYMRHWGGGGWAIASCTWPSQWEKRNPKGLQATPVMRNFAFRKWHRNLTWADHVETVAALGAEAIHLSNAKVRANMLIIASVVLERAVRLVGGDDALTPAQAQCVKLARDWIEKSPGEHGDIIRPLSMKAATDAT